MRRIFAATLKIAISAGLLYFALRNTDFSALASRLTLGSLLWIILAVTAALLQIALASIRWHMLSDYCGAPLRVATTMRFNMIGTFFNQTLPSSIGGDAVRLWLVGRRAGWRAATYSIFIDRTFGLIALALLILISLPWSLGLITDPNGRAALLLIEAGALGASAGFLVMGTLPARWFDALRPLRHAHACAAVAIEILADGRRTTTIAAMSLVVHILTAAVAWSAAQAIAASVNFFQLLLLLPPVALVTLLPVSIAGWGLRETAMGAAFAAAGLPASEGINVSLLYGGVSFLIGALGGLVWITSAEKAQKGQAPIDLPAEVP